MIIIASTVTVEQCFQMFSVHQNPLEATLNPGCLGFLLRVSDSVSLGWGLRMCISKHLSVSSSVLEHAPVCKALSQTQYHESSFFLGMCTAEAST